MPSLSIFFLCLFSVLIGYFLKTRGVRTAYIWMVLVFISFTLWIILIAFPYQKISAIIINDWFRFGETRISLQFALNSQNWILVLSLFAINLTFLLTGITRLDIKSDLANWTFQLLLTTFSFLALISANLWSLVLLWTVIDLLELGFHSVILKDTNEKIYFRKYIVRSIGSILLIWNIALISKSGSAPLINGIVASTPNTSIFLAALIHSGIFPFDPELNRSKSEKSSDLLKDFFIILNFIVSFSIITYLQAPEIPFVLSLSLSIVANILIIFSSIRWAFIREKTFSPQTLLFLVSGVIISLYLFGAAQYITFLLASIIISIMWLALFTHRSKKLSIFPLISTFLISGLPLSLNAFGSRGFIGDGFSIGLIVLLFSRILFIIGYIRFAFDENEKYNELEIWYQVAYLTGLFIPFLSAASIIIFSRKTIIIELQNWWIGSAVSLIAIAGYVFYKRSKTKKEPVEISYESGSKLIQHIGSLDWLFNTFSFIENKVSGFASGFSVLMEGDGGIVWALVLLILIISLIS